MSNADTKLQPASDKKAASEPVHENNMNFTQDSNGATKTESGFPELPEKLERDLVEVFKLLADETRLKILMYLLREQELHVSALCNRLNQSQPAVSHHLALLRESTLISSRRDGKHNFYSVHQQRFHSLIGEIFATMTATNSDKVRFQNFVLTQE